MPRPERVITCNHADFAGYTLDLSEFWDGAPENRKGPGSHNWAGGFQGRPLLADNLIETIRAKADQESPDALRVRRTSLRTFWRYLDAYERFSGDRVERLADVGSVLGGLWLEPPPKSLWSRPYRGAYESVHNLIQSAREEHGLTGHFWWPLSERDKVSRADVPSEEQARELTHVLKAIAHAVYKRWSDSDHLAATGRNLIEVYRRGAPNEEKKATEADCHATYRAIIAETGDPLPDAVEIRRVLGLDPSKPQLPPAWPVTLEQLANGLYPNHDDICCFVALFLARTGWNPATAFALDISNDEWAQPIGDPTANLWWIQSFKLRAELWQDTICSGKVSTGPYQIVTRLIARTAPLRALALTSPERTHLPAIAMRSPWLAYSLGSRGSSVTVVYQTQYVGDQIKRLAREHNARTPHKVQIPETFKSSDFRDVVAAFTFRDSRYSMLLVQWVLGHKHLRSVRSYLRSRMWRQHSEAALKQFGTVLVDEIEVHKRVDPTILRARVENHEVTAEQVERLLAYRTAVGMGCQDSRRPDPHIDPDNPLDGSRVCANGDRCAGCTQGVALWDSLPLLCKKVAKLEWLRGQFAGGSFYESHHADDLVVFEATIKQWPEEDVAAELAKWRMMIRNGSYRPAKFGGEH